jgi:putative FmdB family regulatory protein
MPTYEYECDACGDKFEELQSFKEDPLKDCRRCGQPKLRRLFGTGAAVLFKGSGFYETDYRSESYKKAAKADQEAAPKAAGGKDGAGPSSNGTPAAESSPKSEAKTPKPSP